MKSPVSITMSPVFGKGKRAPLLFLSMYGCRCARPRVPDSALRVREAAAVIARLVQT